MSIDQRKRQKKIERKAAKRRASLKEKRMALGNIAGLPVGLQLEAAVQSPVYQCLVPTGLFSSGIGNVVFSRRLGNGRIAAAYFLVDVSCLGVKDAFLVFMHQSEFDLRKREISRQDPFTEQSPAFVRKLVEDAVSYAAALGLSAHPDYEISKKIFGDVDPSECHEVFTFGEDGKPHFVAGPNDTPAKCQRIIETLQQRLGPNGFYVTAPIHSADLEELEFRGEED